MRNLKDIHHIEKEINLLKKDLSKCPQGSLIICKVKGKRRYYQQKKNSSGAYSRNYLGKEDIELARHLARKAYIREKLLDLDNELNSIKQYQNTRKITDYKRFLAKDSAYRELLIDEGWEFEDYEKSVSHPEHLLISAPKGDIVRSKSEALIANALYESGIPYRYECNLELSGYTIHPDFTIKKCDNNEIIIWEHFGKIDQQKYFNRMIWKLERYIENGYIPGKKLIITWETKATPLSIDEVRKMIMHYLV